MGTETGKVFGELVDELDKRDKQSVLAYHRHYLHIAFGLVTAMMWGRPRTVKPSRPFDL